MYIFKLRRQNINNGLLNNSNSMPLKDSTSDDTSRFSMGRIMYVNTITNNSHKNWIGGNRDASQTTKNRSISAIGYGSMNSANTQNSFVSNTSKNVINDALRRVRSSGYVVPPKNRI
jgi:hypothetical protein